MQEQLLKYGLRMTENGAIKWRNGNINHPRNWPWQRKAYDTAVIIFLDLFTTAISTAGTPASEVASEEFGIKKPLALFAFTTVYLLAQGLGSLFFPPYSECFGRKQLYISSTFLYAAFCVVVAAVPSLTGVFIGRAFMGFISAIPSIVVAGSIEDLYDSEARTWMIYLWAMVANLGLVIGAMFGTYLSHSIGWRWLFYIAAAVVGVVSLLLLFIRESRPSQLLERYVSDIRKKTGNQSLVIQNPDHTPDLDAFFRLVLIRPLRLLFTEPIVFLTSVMSAVAFGLIYLLTAAVPIVYAPYGFSVQQQSLAMIPIGIGFLCGILMRLVDHMQSRKRRRLKQETEPEDKLVGFCVAAPVLAVGLWWFAWTVPPRAASVPWIVSMIALVLIGFSSNEFDCTLAGYLADSYTLFAGSALSGLALLRSLFSAVFPLFTGPMYRNLGPNLASTILAVLATLFCVCPVLFIKYGKRIRAASPFASSSLVIYNENRADYPVSEEELEAS
ncbi:MAG: hypothetical protein Q9188_006435 [Gyalolechia gomerana]